MCKQSCKLLLDSDKWYFRKPILLPMFQAQWKLNLMKDVPFQGMKLLNKNRKIILF